MTTGAAMNFFNEWATGRAIRDATRTTVRYFLPTVGALFLLAAIIHACGGPCILPGSIACSF